MNFRFFWVICITIPTLIPSSVGSSLPEDRPVFINGDSTQAVQVIVSFLIWYKQHYRDVNERGLSYPDKNGWYKVDTSACQTYLQKLMSSTYLTPNYKKAWEEYFSSKAAYWEMSPQNEGPPEGFDYDLVLLTQEPELFFEKPDKLIFDVVLLEKDFAIITATADWPLYFEMTRHKSGWKIDYISSEGYD